MTDEEIYALHERAIEIIGAPLPGWSVIEAETDEGGGRVLFRFVGHVWAEVIAPRGAEVWSVEVHWSALDRTHRDIRHVQPDAIGVLVGLSTLLQGVFLDCPSEAAVAVIGPDERAQRAVAEALGWT